MPDQICPGRVQPGEVCRQKWITRQDVRLRRTAIYLFGDNMQRRGFGGQAKAMRGEPNAIGIPTKWMPDSRDSSYFKDADFDRVRGAIDEAFGHTRAMLSQGFDIVIPADGIGTGLAD